MAMQEGMRESFGEKNIKIKVLQVAFMYTFIY